MKISKINYELLKEKYSNNLDEALKRIEINYPIQYLIGNVNFYGYQINVDERVLIPRFETELLVDETIKLIKEQQLNPKIIDICTGSGCIAITLSKELNTKVDALDISNEALDLAKENAKLNNADVTFYNKDIKNCSFDNKYNVLISNPPYVRHDEEVDPKTKYEPSIALYADNNGLEFYDIILKQSVDILEDKSIIAFEIGCTQRKDIVNMIKKYYPNSNIITKKDLNHLDRYIFVINGDKNDE